jgi:hydroxymethylpyrimidine/phosphomethylpyrimidine kinase
MPSQPIVLSIAGYDPSSGAGVTADIKTAAAHGCYALTSITALTVQSTMGVKRVLPLAPELVSATLAELRADFQIGAVRIGMLGCGEVAQAVADFLDDFAATDESKAIVLDPITRSSSGADLLDAAGLDLIRTRLLPRVTVSTPNLAEASVLTGIPVASLGDAHAAARKLHAMGARAVVVTGGHLEGEAVDLLSTADDQVEEFRAARLNTRSTHGTGCAFAMALACNLTRGFSLRDAVGEAKNYVFRAIARAEPLGHGVGPLNHFPSTGL